MTARTLPLDASLEVLRRVGRDWFDALVWRADHGDPAGAEELVGAMLTSLRSLSPEAPRRLDIWPPNEELPTSPPVAPRAASKAA